MAPKLALVALLAFVAVAAVASLPAGHIISKRAIILDENLAPTDYDLVGLQDEESDEMMMSGSDPVIRTKRGHHHHHLPTWMNTYAMTDHHGHFKWGVRHNIKHH
ncbi:UNVERIFIED_CONTAM: hypothetical protein RMT77_009085 [Armadillidium vulgare]